MAKKVIGIILTVLGGLFLLMAIIFLLVFGGIGTAFLAGSNEVSNSSFMSEATTVSCMGQVVDVNNGQTTIDYTVDGVTYEVSYSITNISYSTGTSVMVYYDQTNPSNCEVPALQADTFGVIGGVFAGFGIVFVIAFGVIGIACLIVGILLIRSYKKQVQAV